MSISKIFKPNFVCLLTIERYKTYQTGLSFRRLGHAPGVGLGGTVGVGGFKNYKVNFKDSKDHIPLDIFESVGICNGAPLNVF